MAPPPYCCEPLEICDTLSRLPLSIRSVSRTVVANLKPDLMVLLHLCDTQNVVQRYLDSPLMWIQLLDVWVLGCCPRVYVL